MSYRNRIERWRRFQGPIMALPMSLMHLWIVQQRRWRLLPLRDAGEQLRIPLEQSVDRLNHLTCNAPNHTGFARVGLCAFIKWAASFDQTLIQPRPFVVAQANHLQDREEH